MEAESDDVLLLPSADSWRPPPAELLRRTRCKSQAAVPDSTPAPAEALCLVRSLHVEPPASTCSAERRITRCLTPRRRPGLPSLANLLDNLLKHHDEWGVLTVGGTAGRARTPRNSEAFMRATLCTNSIALSATKALPATCKTHAALLDMCTRAGSWIS